MISQEPGSPKLSLNSTDAKKIGKGFLIAIGGAALAYAAQILPMLDLGQYQAILFPITSSLVNAGIKYFADNS